MKQDDRKELMLGDLNPRLREVLLDSSIMFCLFYIVANPVTYEFTKQYLPKEINDDPVLVHSFVFSLIYFIMQKVFNKF